MLGASGVLRPRCGEEPREVHMHEDEIARRVARYEHALLALATAKDTPITDADEARAARVTFFLGASSLA